MVTTTHLATTLSGIAGEEAVMDVPAVGAEDGLMAEKTADDGKGRIEQWHG